jgi:uncharacterized protein (TIGR00730 family)
MIERVFRRVCVFSGSRVGSDPSYQQGAHKLGVTLAEQNIELVYGGGSVGLMGIIADSILDSGGRAIGVLPEFLATKELMHKGLNEVFVTQDMHSRKAKMAELSDAFIAMPGGLGTFEELFEMVTWAQLGVHAKPIGLLNINGFYQPLLDLIDHAIEAGFVHESHRQLMIAEPDPSTLLMKLRTQPELDFQKITDIDQT